MSKSRFAQPGIRLIDFSPCETYAVTWSKEVVPVLWSLTFKVVDTPQKPQSIMIWNVQTGSEMKGFSFHEFRGSLFCLILIFRRSRNELG
jgi:translation initiation factor 3 subunit B